MNNVKENCLTTYWVIPLNTYIIAAKIIIDCYTWAVKWTFSKIILRNHFKTYNVWEHFYCIMNMIIVGSLTLLKYSIDSKEIFWNHLKSLKFDLQNLWNLNLKSNISKHQTSIIVISILKKFSLQKYELDAKMGSFYKSRSLD